MEPKIKNIDRKIISGLSVRTINVNEMNTETAKIPSLWDKFIDQDLKTSIPDQVSGSPVYAIYSDYESDVNGSYTLTVGMETNANPESKQNELVVTTIEPGKYLVFEAKGEMPKTVIEAWYQIWDYFSAEQQYKRSYTTDFEIYSDQESVIINIAIT